MISVARNEVGNSFVCRTYVPADNAGTAMTPVLGGATEVPTNAAFDSIPTDICGFPGTEACAGSELGEISNVSGIGVPSPWAKWNS
jgi:hypothetical protein